MNNVRYLMFTDDRTFSVSRQRVNAGGGVRWTDTYGPFATRAEAEAEIEFQRSIDREKELGR